ncbi:hypothetical protein HELRODRAFT_171833 [Helobdella robusta]|uniref:RNase H type-1 domain-containing protein n=1 Tax=Helobdella robusta TaxID=6412 RepID=T1F4R6_HELRO|nr:hypothetical protein HELRODRAFT_171833 [Helobdella robusta]ESO05432.1 hypothetical protein HELRODRAFT_171833 [Helobdella robusta]
MSLASEKNVFNFSCLPPNDDHVSKPNRHTIHDNLNDNNGKKIILIWIPSHIGIEDNEEVDQLASQAHNISISNLPIPHNDLRFWTIKVSMEKWQLEWNQTSNFLKLSTPFLSQKNEFKASDPPPCIIVHLLLISSSYSLRSLMNLLFIYSGSCSDGCT